MGFQQERALITGIEVWIWMLGKSLKMLLTHCWGLCFILYFDTLLVSYQSGRIEDKMSKCPTNGLHPIAEFLRSSIPSHIIRRTLHPTDIIFNFLNKPDVSSFLKISA